jgi:hypothetical protein
LVTNAATAAAPLTAPKETAKDAAGHGSSATGDGKRQRENLIGTTGPAHSFHHRSSARGRSEHLHDREGRTIFRASLYHSSQELSRRRAMRYAERG